MELAFSITVTALITWQIFVLIDIRKIRKEVDTKKQMVNTESERNMFISAMALSDFYYSLLIDEPVKDKEYKYLNYRISALLHASRIDDYHSCNVIVEAILQSVVTDKLSLSTYRKKLLTDLMQEVKQPSNIQNFQTLLRLVLNIRVKD